MGIKKGIRIFYLHWNEDELKQRIQPLLKQGYHVSFHFNTLETAKFDELPDIFVLSLDRLPSHSKAYAAWIFEAKKRQHIRLIFVDGKPDKVEQTKAKFPKAIYCTSDTLISTIKNTSRNNEK